MKILGVFLTVLVANVACATSWNEPWMEDVIRSSDAFVKAEVVLTDGWHVSAKLLKQLAGDPVPKTFEITAPFATEDLKSHFSPNLDYYFFLNHGDKPGQFTIATPTTGWAKILTNGFVYATYRHSYHQALVPADVYEPTMTAIFEKLHNGKVNHGFVDRYINEHLTRKPAPLSSADDDEVRREFFAQHVALECFRFFGSESNLSILDPFLAAHEMHAQISAVRALGGIRSAKASEKLMTFVESERTGFAKVVALDALAAQDSRQLLPRLKKFIEQGKDEETGWGGNLMDPRVGTYFPESVMEAARSLALAWEHDQSVRARFGDGALLGRNSK